MKSSVTQGVTIRGINKMKHLGMTILSLLSSGISGIYIGLLMMFELPLTFIMLVSAVMLSLFYLGLMVLFNFIDGKIRDIDLFGFEWFVNLVLTPIRFPLQIISIIFAIIGAHSDKIDFDYCYYDSITTLLFNFDFDFGGAGKYNYKPSTTDKNSYSGGHSSGASTDKQKKDPYALDKAVDRAITDTRNLYNNTKVYLGTISWEKCDKQISKFNQIISVNVRLKYIKKYNNEVYYGFFDYTVDESTIKNTATNVKNYLSNRLLREVKSVQRNYEGYNFDWKIRVNVNLT